MSIDWQEYLKNENKILDNADRKYRFHNISLEAMSEEMVCRESKVKYSGILFDDEADFINSIKNIRLQNAVKRLTEKQRTVIKLYFWNGYSQPDIALILKIEQASVSKRFTNALKALKNSMK
jgi:RNA polymerase sigma factor (sigma-70 family)